MGDKFLKLTLQDILQPDSSAVKINMNTKVKDLVEIQERGKRFFNGALGQKTK